MATSLPVYRMFFSIKHFDIYFKSFHVTFALISIFIIVRTAVLFEENYQSP